MQYARVWESNPDCQDGRQESNQLSQRWLFTHKSLALISLKHINVIKETLIFFWQFATEEITGVIETRQTCSVLICFCHSVFLGISSPGLIYIDFIFTVNTTYLRFCHICSKASANSTFEISSASWNLRKPSPPWPVQVKHFLRNYIYITMQKIEKRWCKLNMYVCIYLLIVQGKSLQIQHKYFNINIVYPAPRGLSTTFNTKQNIKLSSMTQYD